MNLDGILHPVGHPGTIRRAWARPEGKHNGKELLKLAAGLILVIAVLVAMIVLLKLHNGTPVFK